jgi:hypothetical protein
MKAGQKEQNIDVERLLYPSFFIDLAGNPRQKDYPEKTKSLVDKEKIQVSPADNGFKGLCNINHKLSAEAETILVQSLSVEIVKSRVSATSRNKRVVEEGAPHVDYVKQRENAYQHPFSFKECRQNE